MNRDVVFRNNSEAQCSFLKSIFVNSTNIDGRASQTKNNRNKEENRQ